MESKYPAAEAVVIAFSLGTFVAYHVWFFGLFSRCISKGKKKGYYGINGLGKLGRILFTWAITAKTKSGILGVQQNRNVIMAATFQASIASLFFNELLDILLTPSKMEAIQSFSRHDPFLREPDDAAKELADGYTDAQIGLVSGLTVVVINMAIILGSLMLFVTCVRLLIHLGYMYTAAAVDEHIEVGDALRVTMEAQVTYTVGQRMIFFFPITAMWLLGPIALLCTSVVVTSGVVILDRWDSSVSERHMNAVVATPRASSGTLPLPKGESGAAEAVLRGASGRVEGTPFESPHEKNGGLGPPGADAAPCQAAQQGFLTREVSLDASRPLSARERGKHESDGSRAVAPHGAPDRDDCTVDLSVHLADNKRL